MTDVKTNINPTVALHTVSRDLAEALVAGCAEKAREIGKPMTIAVCDQAGTLKSFLRMDGAPLLSVDIAQNKAYTAASFGITTDQWHEFIKDDPPLAAGIPHTPRLVVFGGGFPIMVDGELVGGLGVSGGHYTDDMEVGRAGLAAVGLSTS
jgi:uncharacterized protein GlcG (DUF336 family)